MIQQTEALSRIRLHLTNVTGAGASQLLLSLLPALERHPGLQISEIHLPDSGSLADYQPVSDAGISKRYKRRLPNALSRIVECLALGHQFDGAAPLLVLGDLPLRCDAPQVVFVQTSHLLRPTQFHLNLAALKFWISRQVFRLNARFAQAFIVQTVVMKAGLAASYPSIADKIHVIAQPVPSWLLEGDQRRSGPRARPGAGFKLFYPAAAYPHKNHKLLANIESTEASVWPIETLVLTLPAQVNPAPHVSWIRCVGFLSPAEMIRTYAEVDGLLFLSTDESYGFPLVEAMFLGLPIVCPDLAYAHALCSDQAIYFDPASISSLHHAVDTLSAKLASGWWPDWTGQISELPKSWDVVADEMIDVVRRMA